MKLTKTQSGYINPPDKSIQPSKGKGIRCGTCVFYKNKRCRIVTGQVQSQGCCNLWSHGDKLHFNFDCGRDIEDLIKNELKK